MRTRFKLVLVMFALIFCSTIFATPTDDIVAIFKDLNTIQGQFKQTLYNQNQRIISVSNGTFMIERPNKFVWNVVSPSAQQSISNGSVVWIYQPDLEQATKSQLTKQLGATPLAILSGSVEALKKAYQITSDPLQGKDKDTRIFIFHSNDQNSPFSSVRLIFKSNQLTQMQLLDNLGQKTQIDFSQVVRNHAISDGAFNFSPPKGTDIVE